MHLVCLGVMRRLLMFWCSGPRKTRISQDMRQRISGSLALFSNHCPSDFARKPRRLDTLNFWKAVEYRCFILYSGILCLKSVLSSAMYKNFLLFHSAIFVLCDPENYFSHIDFAERSLVAFVNTCKSIYGRRMLVYNLHALIHLARDCRRHGPLMTFLLLSMKICCGKLKENFVARPILSGN